EDNLYARIVFTRLALEIEADLRLQRLEVVLVLRPRLHCDVEALEVGRAHDVLGITRLDDEDAVRLHVAGRARLLEPIRRDEDPADDRVALLRVQRGDEARERRLQRLRALTERLRQ